MTGDVIHDLFLIATFAVYALAIYNCIRIISQNLNPQTAMAWIMVNIAFPWIGVPLYFLIGQNRLRRYARLRQHSEVRLTTLKSGDAEPDATDIPYASPHYDLFHRVLTRMNRNFRPRPCRVELLIDGENAFPAIFQAITEARHYIFVQYYILRADRLGLELKRLLIDKARSGVAIYLIFDDIGSFWLNRSYVRELEKAGVQVARFLPLNLPGSLQVNFRNHRKLVLVDGSVAFTGGLNVGDEYVGKSRLAYWRDTHVRVEGAAVNALKDVFLTDWYFAAKKRIKLAPLKIAGALGESPPPPAPTVNAQAQVVPFGPNDKDFIGILLFMQIIQAAQKRLWIATPYFVPDIALERMLELAVLRGVDVRILIPQKSDHHVVYWVSLSYAHELRSRGLKIYLYTKGFMHQKVMVIDDTVAVLGTSNFDNRTFYLNFETVLVLHSLDVNRQTAAMLEADFKDSVQLEPGVSELSRLDDFRIKLARLLAPLM